MITQQNSMNFRVPASKNVDPVTSDLAEEIVTKSGKRESQCLEIHAALSNKINYTSAELAEEMKPADREWRYTVARRLPDLMNLRPAMAGQGKKRKCTVSGILAVTWYSINE